MLAFAYRNHSLMSPTSWLINEKPSNKTVGPSCSLAEETTAIQTQKAFLQKKEQKIHIGRFLLGGSCFTLFFPWLHLGGSCLIFFPSSYKYPIFSQHRVSFAPLHPTYCSCNPVVPHHLRHSAETFFEKQKFHRFQLSDVYFPKWRILHTCLSIFGFTINN